MASAITYEMVEKACNDLQAAGEKVTYLKIHEHLGQGSTRIVTAHMRRWREAHMTAARAGEDLLFQYGIQHWIDFIFDTLYNNGLSLLQTIFEEEVLELRIVEIGQRAVFIHRFSILFHDPILTLALRINEKWVTCRVGNHDTVLNGQVILGETL